MNSLASQSSSSRCVGHSPCEPRSSSTLDKPIPNNSRQVRLTKARDVSGFPRETSQLARSSRVARSPFCVQRSEKFVEWRVPQSAAGIIHPVGARQNVRHSQDLRRPSRERGESPSPAARARFRVAAPRHIRLAISGLDHCMYSRRAVRSSSSRSSAGRCAAPSSHLRVRPLDHLLGSPRRNRVPRVGGQAYGSAASARRNRPITALRNSDSWRSVMTIRDVAEVFAAVR